MLPFRIAELGTTMTLLSTVRIVVEKMLISWTVPSAPPPVMYSPTFTGRKQMSITPEAKFESEPWRARPIARPAAPRTATKEAVAIPILPSAAITTKAMMPYLMILPTNFEMVGSILRFVMNLVSPRPNIPANQIPTTKITIAYTQLSPLLIASSLSCCTHVETWGVTSVVISFAIIGVSQKNLSSLY